MRHKFYLGMLAMTLMFSTLSNAQTLQKFMSSTNGDVYTVYKSGGSYYLGGSFTYVGLKTGYDLLTNATNDNPNMDFPGATNGQVYCSIPDGSGGWYVGG